jgi:hypothetical protein
MPKPAEIVAALGDVSAIDSYETLQTEMVDLFTCMADDMKSWDDKRPAQIMRKMAATVDTVPYDMLAEFGHNYNPVLLALTFIRKVARNDLPDYADAYDLMLTLLDDLQSIDLDHPDTQRFIEEVEAIFTSRGQPRPDL